MDLAAAVEEELDGDEMGAMDESAIEKRLVGLGEKGTIRYVSSGQGGGAKLRRRKTVEIDGSV